MNLFDPDTNVIVFYEKQPDGSNLFLTTYTLTDRERDHLKSTLWNEQLKNINFIKPH